VLFCFWVGYGGNVVLFWFDFVLFCLILCLFVCDLLFILFGDVVLCLRRLFRLFCVVLSFGVVMVIVLYYYLYLW